MFKTFATAALVVSFAGAAMAEQKNTGATFLQLPLEVQHGYIQTASMAIGVIALKNRKGQAKCIDDWGAANEKTGYQPIMDAMKKYSEYHPMPIIIEVLSKACGTFEYAPNAATLQ